MLRKGFDWHLAELDASISLLYSCILKTGMYKTEVDSVALVLLGLVGVLTWISLRA